MNNFSNRKFIISGIFILVVFIFIIRLFILQIVDDSYKIYADNNTQRKRTEYPARGLIYDRNGKLLVSNQAVYDLMIIPRQLRAFDTLDFCSIVGIDTDELLKRIAKAKVYSRYKASIFDKQLSSERYAVLQEKLHKFQGFFVQVRTLRQYTHNSAPHVLGYIREVNRYSLRDKYYKSGDYIGITGIERAYEKELRGVKGQKVFLVDVHNRIQGSYKKGLKDKKAIAGKNLISTIDIDLQEYGELLMKNKIGSIVAIEPKTGEILAKISSPSYDPQLLVGRNLGANYSLLRANDSLRPLFDRSLMAQYPPGSIFKLVNALVGLQEGVIEPETKFNCSRGYHQGRFTLKCHGHVSPLNLMRSVQHSCNAYYVYTFKYILENSKYDSAPEGYDAWRKHVLSFGIGRKLGSDFNNELSGFVPERSYYDKKLRRKRWKALNIISLSIGQGELMITPLQMVNMTATIANRGHYYIPHIVKSIGDEFLIDPKFKAKQKTTIDPSYFDSVIEGMNLVVSGGPGSTGVSAAIPGIEVCGKTGTVQNRRTTDHSVFVAFAPKDDPKIAIVVYVEYGGWGARYGAPISGLMIEKYLRGSISKSKLWTEKRMLNADLINKKRK